MQSTIPRSSPRSSPRTGRPRPVRVAGAAALATAALVGGAAYGGSVGQAAASGAAGGGHSASGDTSLASAASASTAPARAKLRLQTSSPALDACFPHAWAKVKVDLTTDDVGKDRFRIKARGLRPDTAFTVFLIEKAGAPFGAVEYIGDFTTNHRGRASNTFDLIVEEAFAFDNETQERTDLNSVGFWFADEKDDDDCLGAASPVTGFDGDGAAGVQMMNSGVRLLP